MAIFNANEMIRAIRKNAGLSQEEFCEGICSTQALSNIENGKNGISPITFEKLTARANMNVRPFPSFASVKDYNCFMDLHRAEFFVESWQFRLAYGVEETSKIREYYVTKLNEHNILQIMGHELAHHISLFSDDADDAPEIALFEEMGGETIAGSESIYATYTNN